MPSSRPRDVRGGLRPSLDALPDVFYVMTAGGDLRFLGAPAKKLYGRSMTALKAADDFRLVGLDDDERARVAAAYAGLRDRKWIELRYVVRRPDGGETAVCERLSRRDGFVQGVIAPLRTRDELALPSVLIEALGESEALFAVVGFDGVMRWVNGAYRRQLGHDPRALVGQSYRELIHPEDRVAVQSAHARVDDPDHQGSRVDCRVRSADGEWRWYAFVGLTDRSRERSYTIGVEIEAGKRAEAALGRARDIAAVARTATYDGLWDVDLVTGEINCNARFYAMLGYRSGEIEFRYDNWLKVVHPDDRERVSAAFEDHLWGEAPMYQLEHRLLRRDGSVCWVLARGQVVTRQGGFNPLRMIGSYTDVTERRLVEDALARSEERARCIVEAVTVPMVITRLSDGAVSFANPHAVSRFGRRCDPDEGGDFYAGVAERAAFVRGLEQDGHVGQLEMTMPRDDGDPIFVITSASLIEFDGEPAVLATFSDITERRRAEEAIRERNETLDLILRTTSDGIWDWDLRTDVVRYSARWKEMLGYAPDELADHADTWRGLIHADDAPIAERRLREHLDTGAPFEHTSRYRHRDGTLRYILVRGHAIRDDDGPSRMVGNHTDITDQMRARDERRKMEDRLQNAQRLESMGVMAKGVAHDFNNLMMAVLGNAELALLDLPARGAETAADDVRDALGEIALTARRASELCNQLLAYAGEGELRFEPMHIGDLIIEMRQLLEATVSRKAHLILDCEADLPATRGDPNRLRQAIANLVLNASDALGGLPGNIRITTGLCDPTFDADGGAAVDPLPEGFYLYADVIDDGAGIDPEIVPRIFDPFFTTRRGSGRGLGLAAALGVVRSHGGSIAVDSEPGAGSRFRLLLPIVDEARRVGPDRITGETPAVEIGDYRGEGTILLVDDEDGIRAVGQRVLERVGFTVLLAVDGREAVARFRAAGQDLRGVVLDLTMPELGGEEVYRILREMRLDVPILLMSGFPEHSATQGLADDAHAEFLAKPFTHTQLIASLARLLDRR